LRKIFKFLNPISNTKDFYKTTYKSGLGIEEQKHIHSMLKDKIRVVKSVSENNDPWAPDAPDMADFNQVLQHWGIHRHDLPMIIRNLWIQMILFGLGGIYGVWWMLFADSFIIAGAPLAFLGLLTIVVRSWRIQVLTEEKFVFFKDWFLGGMFSWIGRPTPFAVYEKQKRGGE
jgi:hypothetical protein